jgi:hypothetical protein
VPVRTAATPPPGVGDLPADIAAVSKLQAHHVEHHQLTTGIGELADRIATLVPELAGWELFAAAADTQARGLLSCLRTLAGQPDDTVDRYLRWLKRLYPGPRSLNPRQPDRLGEDHSVATIRAEPSTATNPLRIATGAEAADSYRRIAAPVPDGYRAGLATLWSAMAT